MKRYHGMMRLVVILLMVFGFQIALTAATIPNYGGTLTVGVEHEFRGFDPLKAGYLQFGDRSVISAIEERLFGMDESGNIVPELALSAIPSQDGRVWTITLRQGVSFHDGTVFNSNAVVEHWQRLLAAKQRSSSASLVEPVQSVTEIDDHTIRFTLKHPWAALMAILSSPQWTGAYIPSPKAVREDRQNHAPVGTGPFTFKEWLPNDRLVVNKNPGYWRKGRPYLDSIVFRPVPDVQARFTGLQSGSIDLIQTDWGQHIIQARKNSSLKVYSSDAGGPYAFILNTSSPPLNDVRVRRALAHAWNQDFHVKAVNPEIFPVVKDPFGGALSCGDCGYRRFDPALSRKLLAEYGKPITLELLVSDSAHGRKAGEIMQRLFKEIGITLKFTPLPEGQLVTRVMGGDYQIAGWRFMDLSDMGPYLNLCLHSKGRLNFSHYQNPAMDELLNAQHMSTDRTARQSALCRVATLINEDAIYLYRGGRRFHILARENIRGVARIEQGVIRLGEAWIQVVEKPSPNTAPKKPPKKRR